MKQKTKDKIQDCVLVLGVACWASGIIASIIMCIFSTKQPCLNVAPALAGLLIFKVSAMIGGVR